jgi:hypothetical protein
MNAREPILAYLKTHIPAYPFDPHLDELYVDELIDDFAELDILAETKAFRWYYNNQPASRFKSVRAGLHRWLANARAKQTA